MKTETVKYRIYMAAYLMAALVPLTVAFDLEPIPGTVQQLLAMLAWGFAIIAGTAINQSRFAAYRSWPVTIVLLMGSLVCLAMTQSLRYSGSPDSGLLAAGALLAATAVFWTTCRNRRDLVSITSMFYKGLLLAGLLNSLVAILQLLAPALADDIWIATGSLPGRANGNLHQPNHLAMVLLWSTISLGSLVELGHLKFRSAIPALGLLTLGIILSASRLGLFGCLLIGVWGALDRTMKKPQRQLFVLTPIFALFAWVSANAIAGHTVGMLALSQKTSEWGSTSGRLQAWTETLRMIGENPVFGVGWGEYNFAWTLSEKAVAQVHYFGNAHNFPLHMAAELGVPFALMICSVLIYSFYRAWQYMAASHGEAKTLKRAAVMMLALMAVHSNLEYPLWSLAFLLPTAFLLGICTADDCQTVPSRTTINWPALAGVLMMIAAIGTFFDYLKLVKLTSVQARSNSAEMQQALTDARGSFLYSWVAFRVTALGMPNDPLAVGAVQYAAHGALDVPLMIAWSNALKAAGDEEKARYVARRIAEVTLPETTAFFQPCKTADRTAKPYQCFGPQHALTFRDFRQP